MALLCVMVLRHRIFGMQLSLLKLNPSASKSAISAAMKRFMYFNDTVYIMEWIFEGIGTAIITFVLGIVAGGSVGYYIGVQTSIKQKQKAKDNAKQTQIGIQHGNH